MDIREEMKDYVGADMLFAQMEEIKALREENTEQAARIAAIEADKAKLIDLLKKYQDGYYTDGVIGLTAGFDEAVSRVLAEVTK